MSDEHRGLHVVTSTSDENDKATRGFLERGFMAQIYLRIRSISLLVSFSDYRINLVFCQRGIEIYWSKMKRFSDRFGYRKHLSLGRIVIAEIDHRADGI